MKPPDVAVSRAVLKVVVFQPVLAFRSYLGGGGDEDALLRLGVVPTSWPLLLQ